ncbi:hypothetical protein [Polaribacter gangjinensis]|uniref:Uncharacterized protein n=1 Tax=Polaribacter gangjinensis TaxID=574710 RepID=A0A2S7W8B3_9FLAO|nr:hypothetical protein [Polaribacter gangjinensis]PQJ73870.1 hypothetical protein BTO13_00620 [Polaribacter gangjinensis]
MEEVKNQNELDAFAKKYVKEIELDSPSKDFTSLLMQRIENQKSVVFSQQELISKKGWFAILTVAILVFFFSSKTSEKSMITIPELDFSFLSKMKFSQTFEFLSLSNITLIALLLFGGMLIFQLLYLKNHFDKRFE